MKKIVSIVLSLLMIISVAASMGVTAYAETAVNTVAFSGVKMPRPGNSPAYDYTISGAGFTVGSTSPAWYEEDNTGKITPLAKDGKFVAGKKYRVQFAIYSAAGYALSDSLTATIDGYPAQITTNGGRNKSVSVCVYYTFVCENKEIAAINLVATTAFTRGTVLKNDYFTASGEGVLPTAATTFTKDGEAIALGEKVTAGDYGATVLVAPQQGYKITANTAVKYNSNVFKFKSMIGAAGFFESASNLWQIDCTHSYGAYKYDADKHWKECSVCGETANVAAHDFNKSTVGGDTVYTCNDCGFVLTSKNKVDGFLYAEVDGGVKITAYDGSATNVNIPATLNGKTVVSIGNYTFATNANKANITSITIPSTVKSIGANAFNGCSALTNVNIPAGVKRIEKSTFFGCAALSSITIPYGVTEISESAFQGAGITAIVIPCSVTKIGGSAFRSCASLESIVIPDSVTSLGDAFMGCSSLKSVVIGNGVTALAQATFDGASNLESIVLPAGLTSIGKYNFDNKANFKNIYFRGTQQQYNAITVASSNTNSAAVTFGFDTRYDVGQHKYAQFKVVDPTCVEKGYTVVACEGCGDAYKTNETNATGVHKYNSGAVTVEADCIHEGVKTYLCNDCGAQKTEEIAATGVHKYDGGTVTTEATCGKAGVKTFVCEVCSEKKTEKIAATGKHTYGSAWVNKAATLSKDGSLGYTCKVCGNKKYSAFAKIKTVALSKTAYTYDGKVKKPGVTVKDSKGKAIATKYYKVTYASGRKSVGKYSVKITFKDRYSGSKTLYFKINPKGTALSGLTAGKKAFTAKWKKQTTQTTGYQLQYTTDKNFKKSVKTVTIAKNKTLSKAVKKLTAKKKYYVRVRTYKTVKKDKFYSGWSKAKAVTTKK